MKNKVQNSKQKNSKYNGNIYYTISHALEIFFDYILSSINDFLRYFNVSSQKCTGLLCESFYRCHLKTFRVGNQLITTYIINCGVSEQ